MCVLSKSINKFELFITHLWTGSKFIGFFLRQPCLTVKFFSSQLFLSSVRLLVVEEKILELVIQSHYLSSLAHKLSFDKMTLSTPQNVKCFISFPLSCSLYTLKSKNFVNATKQKLKSVLGTTLKRFSWKMTAIFWQSLEGFTLSPKRFSLTTFPWF